MKHINEYNGKNRVGVIFAGQGTQKLGLGQDFYQSEEEFSKVFDLLSDELKSIWTDNMDLLNKTEYLQPIITAYQMGVYRSLVAKGFKFYATCGLSLGEYCSVGAADIISDKDLLDLVTIRGKAMADASKNIDCSMKAVLGIDEKILEECVALAASKTGKLVNMVNFNCPNQIVISGEKVAVDLCSELAAEKGARRVLELNTSGPFHTRFMESAGEKVYDFVNTLTLHDPKLKIAYNLTGKYHQVNELADLLKRQVCNPVRFMDCINTMIEDGVLKFVEIGAGKTLSSMVKKINKNVKVYSVERLEDVDGLKEFWEVN